MRTSKISEGPGQAPPGGKGQDDKRVRQARLKAFRSVAGFNDAYVAAPSRKAALAAWGSSKDLFATGAAELVDPAKAPREVFDQPGQVVLLSRGSLAEQLSAGSVSPKGTAALRKASDGSQVEAPEKVIRPSPLKVSKPEPKSNPRPAPIRTRLDAAERELAGAIASSDRKLAELDKRIRSLETRKNKLLAQSREQVVALKAKVAREAERHRAALEKWAAGDAA